MKQSEFLEIIEQNKGKHRQSLETLIQGRKNEQFNYNPLLVVIATDDTNLPLMNIARTYGWIKQDATEFYESEANNITNIAVEIVNTFVNTHTQETLDTPYGTYTLDLWYDKDENKWYDTTELFSGNFSLTNISFKRIRPIKSQDGETAKLYEQIDWTNIEHFNEFKYFTSVTTIDDNTFYDCTSLTSVIIPDSVTSIGSYAFSDCSGLTSVTIGSGVTSISGYAFYNCSSLISITSLATTAPTIENNTFRDVKTEGTLYVPTGSNYNTWMGTGNYYLGKYNWTKVEQ